MSDVSQGPGWWQASDGKWYAPELRETSQGGQPGTPATPTQPGGFGAPAQYPGQGVGGVPGQPSVQGLSVASMVLGIVGIVLAFCFWPVGVICALVGLPLGGVALSKISKGEASAQPKGMAVTGLVLNVITLALAIAAAIWIASVWNSL